jgi:hypothetical protein
VVVHALLRFSSVGILHSTEIHLKTIDMSWNYRVLKQKSIYGNSDGSFTEEETFAIYEVYYDDDGKVNGYGKEATVYGESVSEVRQVLEMMKEALDKPVIDVEFLGIAR